VRTCEIWSIEDGQSIMRTHHRGWPADIAFSPDGRRALIVSMQQPSFLSGLLDLSSGVEIAVLPGHTSETHRGTFSHDSRLAATVSIEGTARLWDGATGELRRVFGEESGLVPTTVDFGNQNVNGAFSPDDRLFATASVHGMARIWDVESGALLAVIQGHSGAAFFCGTERTGARPRGSKVMNPASSMFDLARAGTFWRPRQLTKRRGCGIPRRALSWPS
jgi:WD40 repeat protein